MHATYDLMSFSSSSSSSFSFPSFFLLWTSYLTSPGSYSYSYSYRYSYMYLPTSATLATLASNKSTIYPIVLSFRIYKEEIEHKVKGRVSSRFSRTPFFFFEGELRLTFVGI